MDPVTGGLIIGGANFLGGLAKDDGADVARNQMKLLQQRFAEGEPLRAMGLARLQQPLPERPDQSAAFADPSNPFAVTPQAIGFGKGYSNQTPDLQGSLDDYRALGLGPYGKESAQQQEMNAAGGKRPLMRERALDMGVDPRALKVMGL